MIVAAQTSIAALLSRGEIVGGPRSRERARKLLPDFRKALVAAM
jgi:hypothetical protein